MATGGNTHQIFGKYNTAMGPPEAQLAGIPIAVGTPGRAIFPGPKVGRFSVQFFPAGTFTGSATIWYSNLYSPDPNTAAHWKQDTSVGTAGTITLATGVTEMVQTGNVCAEWVKVEVTTATGTMVLAALALTARESH